METTQIRRTCCNHRCQESNWNFYITTHSEKNILLVVDIESEKEAINRVSTRKKISGEKHLDGRLVFGGNRSKR